MVGFIFYMVSLTGYLLYDKLKVYIFFNFVPDDDSDGMCEM